MLNSRFIKVIAALLLVVAVAFFSLNLGNYAQKIAQIATYKARAMGVELKFESPILGFLSFGASRLGVTFPQALIGVVFDEAQIKAGFMSLVELNPQIDFTAKAYGGKISGSINQLSGSESPKLRLSGHSIKIGEHRQIAAFGISGDLDITESWVELMPKNPPQAELHLSIKDGKKPAPTQIDLTPFGAPFSITLPPIPWFNIGLDGFAKGNSIENLEFSMASALGSINGTGTLWLSSRKLIERVSLEVKVALTDSGKKEFGAIIALTSNGQVPSSASEFTAIFKGPALRPNLEFKNIQ